MPWPERNTAAGVRPPALARGAHAVHRSIGMAQESYLGDPQTPRRVPRLPLAAVPDPRRRIAEATVPALSTNGPVNVVGQDAESKGIVHTGACVGPDALRLDLVATLGGGAVTGLAISPTFVRDGTCFAATMAGLFRSEDTGERWNRVGDPLAAQAISPAYARDGTLLVADRAAGVYRVVGGDGRSAISQETGGEPPLPRGVQPALHQLPHHPGQGPADGGGCTPARPEGYLPA